MMSAADVSYADGIETFVTQLSQAYCPITEVIDSLLVAAGRCLEGLTLLKKYINQVLI